MSKRQKRWEKKQKEKQKNIKLLPLLYQHIYNATLDVDDDQSTEYLLARVDSAIQGFNEIHGSEFTYDEVYERYVDWYVRIVEI